MPAWLAQQDNENRLMEGRVPTSPIMRHHEQGVGGPPPSNLIQFVHFSCRSQPHGRNFLRSVQCPVTAPYLECVYGAVPPHSKCSLSLLITPALVCL
jgi:hypothetical protein